MSLAPSRDDRVRLVDKTSFPFLKCSVKAGQYRVTILSPNENKVGRRGIYFHEGG